MLAIEAPAIIVVEAKQADLKTEIGQCVAEMVAAQKFNEAKNQPISTIYGSVRTGYSGNFSSLKGKQSRSI